jgi:hypothetical protein
MKSLTKKINATQYQKVCLRNAHLPAILMWIR